MLYLVFLFPQCLHCTRGNLLNRKTMKFRKGFLRLTINRFIITILLNYLVSRHNHFFQIYLQTMYELYLPSIIIIPSFLQYGLLEVQETLKVGLKSFTMNNGVRYVMMPGTSQTPGLYVNS